MAHEELKKIYEADSLWHPRPWELWEYEDCGIFGTPTCEPFWHPDNKYRRKSDAPEKNCAMCKHQNKQLGICILASRNNIAWGHYPDWCPLDQPKEEPAEVPSPTLLSAAIVLKEYLLTSPIADGFDIPNEIWGPFSDAVFADEKQMDVIHKFASNILDNIKDLEPEFSKTVDENFWDLK